MATEILMPALEELEAADSSRLEEDPDVFDRVTAVPGEAAAAIAAEACTNT